MNILIAGKHMELGDSLKGRIADGLEASVRKYFDRPGEGNVTVSKNGHETIVDCQVHLPSGLELQSSGRAPDPYAALDNALDKMEKRVRRYKRRLKDHHRPNRAPLPEQEVPAYVLRSIDEGTEPDAGSDQSDSNAPLVVAETAEKIKTMSVAEAVMQLELAEHPALLFKNITSNRINMVFHRPDGNIGWVDPDMADKLA